jgi:hypothetical protein
MNRPLSRIAGSRRTLSRAECCSRLRYHHEGRIGYQTGRGWRSVVVTFRTHADEVLIRLPDYHDAVHYAPGQDVTFEVCEPGAETDRLDEIKICGQAALAGDDPEPEAEPFEEPPWPGTTMRVIRVPTQDISGFTEPV